MSDNTTELDFGTTAQKATDGEKLPVVLLALDQGRYDMTRSLDELRALADANGMDAVAEVVQKRATPEAATMLGEGKVAEARLVCQNVNAAAVIYDGELTGSQLRNLSAALQLEVLDRTMLILEIFRARATTNEGKLQTELAELEQKELEKGHDKSGVDGDRDEDGPAIAEPSVSDGGHDGSTHPHTSGHGF